MAEWKKVIVSGSNAELAHVTASGGISATAFVGDGSGITGITGVSDNNFTTVLKNKLDAIEASADVTDATNVTSAGALMDSEVTDLAGVKGVTISTLQVKPTEGAFANGDKTKLDAIEASADVTDATNVTAAGALMDSELTDLAGVKGVTISTLQAKPSEGAFANGDKTKLDGIATSANNYVHPTTAGNKHIPTGGTVGQILKNTASGTATWQADSNTTYSVGDGGLTTNDFTDADHNKLNAIEASADVTDATNVTAAGALMDSELTNLAAVKAINQSLVNSASPTFANLTLSGDLVVNGDTTTINTANLNVEDQFIFIASGSSAATDSGIIFANTAGSGSSFFFDAATARPSWATAVAADAVAVTPTAYIPRVFDIDGGHTAIDEMGSMKVDSGDIYIYV